MNRKRQLRSLAISALAFVFIAVGIHSLRAQSTGQYELLDQDQIVRELTREPNIGGVPNAAPTQSRGQPATTTNNVFVFAPASISVLLSRYDVLVRIPSITISRLTFKSGSSALTAQSARSLAKLTGALRKMLSNSPNEIFLIEGHTDAAGSPELNLRLSEDRAKAVRDYLVYVGGIPSDNLIYHGFGSSQLAVNTQKSEIQNRRVEIRRITPFVVLRSVPKADKVAAVIPSVLDCGKIGGQSIATLVMVNFGNRQEAQRIRELWSKLPAVSSQELVEANAVFLRYQVNLSSSGCRLVEQLEAQIARAGPDVEKTVSVSLRGSLIRIEKN
jgi:outer membrane protein OmpA-like peptidoglycan-associated protein